MHLVPLELRQRIVRAYTEGRTRTYAETAELFGVSTATVNRLLRRHREKQPLEVKAWERGRKSLIDLAWLEEHATHFPDATLQERAEAWESHSGHAVHPCTVGRAMSKLGWTHKKRHR